MNWIKVCFCVFWINITGVSGHAKMLDPPMRSSLWRFGYNVPVNYNDNQLFCGGYRNTARYDGRCGVCGDPYQGPYENEAGGMFATDIIPRRYDRDAYINVTIDVTAFHKGYFEFRICPNNDVHHRVKQECLDKHLLKIAKVEFFPLIDDVYFDIEPFVPGSTRYFPEGKGIYKILVIIPDDLRCSQCVLQWKYTTGNFWGTLKNGTSCLGCGYQELFVNCADIAIGYGTVPDLPPILSNEKTVFQTQPTAQSHVSKRTTSHSHLNLATEIGGEGECNRCYALPTWNHHHGMDKWCDDNCKVGNCPPCRCYCGCPALNFVNPCEGKGEEKGHQMDTWCWRECCEYECPLDKCRCSVNVTDPNSYTYNVEREFVTTDTFEKEQSTVTPTITSTEKSSTMVKSTLTSQNTEESIINTPTLAFSTLPAVNVGTWSLHTSPTSYLHETLISSSTSSTTDTPTTTTPFTTTTPSTTSTSTFTTSSTESTPSTTTLQSTTTETITPSVITTQSTTAASVIGTQTTTNLPSTTTSQSTTTTLTTAIPVQITTRLFRKPTTLSITIKTNPPAGDDDSTILGMSELGKFFLKMTQKDINDINESLKNKSGSSFKKSKVSRHFNLMYPYRNPVRKEPEEEIQSTTRRTTTSTTIPTTTTTKRTTTKSTTISTTLPVVTTETSAVTTEHTTEKPLRVNQIQKPNLVIGTPRTIFPNKNTSKGKDYIRDLQSSRTNHNNVVPWKPSHKTEKISKHTKDTSHSDIQSKTRHIPETNKGFPGVKSNIRLWKDKTDEDSNGLDKDNMQEKTFTSVKSATDALLPLFIPKSKRRKYKIQTDIFVSDDTESPTELPNENIVTEISIPTPFIFINEKARDIPNDNENIQENSSDPAKISKSVYLNETNSYFIPKTLLKAKSTNQGAELLSKHNEIGHRIYNNQLAKYKEKTKEKSSLLYVPVSNPDQTESEINEKVNLEHVESSYSKTNDGGDDKQPKQEGISDDGAKYLRNYNIETNTDKDDNNTEILVSNDSVLYEEGNKLDPQQSIKSNFDIKQLNKTSENINNTKIKIHDKMPTFPPYVSFYKPTAKIDERVYSQGKSVVHHNFILNSLMEGMTTFLENDKSKIKFMMTEKKKNRRKQSKKKEKASFGRNVGIENRHRKEAKKSKMLKKSFKGVNGNVSDLTLNITDTKERKSPINYIDKPKKYSNKGEKKRKYHKTNSRRSENKNTKRKSIRKKTKVNTKRKKKNKNKKEKNHKDYSKNRKSKFGKNKNEKPLFYPYLKTPMLYRLPSYYLQNNRLESEKKSKTDLPNRPPLPPPPVGHLVFDKNFQFYGKPTPPLQTSTLKPTFFTAPSKSDSTKQLAVNSQVLPPAMRVKDQNSKPYESPTMPSIPKEYSMAVKETYTPKHVEQIYYDPPHNTTQNLSVTDIINLPNITDIDGYKTKIVESTSLDELNITDVVLSTPYDVPTIVSKTESNHSANATSHDANGTNQMQRNVNYTSSDGNRSNNYIESRALAANPDPTGNEMSHNENVRPTSSSLSHQGAKPFKKEKSNTILRADKMERENTETEKVVQSEINKVSSNSVFRHRNGSVLTTNAHKETENVRRFRQFGADILREIFKSPKVRRSDLKSGKVKLPKNKNAVIFDLGVLNRLLGTFRTWLRSMKLLIVE